MIERPRLIPAVILGAMGLLTLKALGWMGGTAPEVVNAPVPAVQTDAAGRPKLKGWAEVIGHARAPYVVGDPDTTGSVDKKDEKKKDEKKKDEPVLGPNPYSKAGVINGTERPVSPAEKALLERLGERRDEIDGRMRELEMREKMLDTAEKKVDGRVNELKQIEDKISETKDKKDQAEQQALKNLVVMYEAMKPKDAARIFDRLTIDILLPVVQQMNPRKMSEVLASMSSESAEKLTIAIAMQARSKNEKSAMTAAPAALSSTELQAIEPQPKR
jgi:flagellar motility protein MotE (MotC chaperone)